ncbi:MAG: alkaline phosphatase family protein, partial [bacterium]|nr:alkaline phosphatase family protein [bacterium]
FATMDDFVRKVKSRGGPIVFIGMDGASWDIINPMIERGQLPTFQRLKEEGAHGVLESVDCYFTPPAWTSMLSGYRPEKTGVYTFGSWEGKGNVFRTVSSLDVQVPRIWDVASGAGRQVAVINVPVTYPARKVNGVMASGLLTPLGFGKQKGGGGLPVVFRALPGPFYPPLDDKTYSPRKIAASRFADNLIYAAVYDTIDDGVEEYTTSVLKIFPHGVEHDKGDDVPAYVWKHDHHGPWIRISDGTGKNKRDVCCSFKVRMYKGPGGRGSILMTPRLRLANDPDLRMTYPKSFADDIVRDIGCYHSHLSYAPPLIPPLTQRTTDYARYFYRYDDWDLFLYVFMAPDNIQHREGFSKLAERVYEKLDRYLERLIKEMPDAATLVIASDHGFKKYKFVIDLNRYFHNLKLIKDINRPDFDKSLVFHDRWALYFNKRLLTFEELQKRGIPIEGFETPRQALILYLQSMCRQITMTKSDRFFPVELIEVPEDAVGDPPDMIVTGGYTDYFVEGSDLKIHSNSPVREARPRESNYHAKEGIYMMWGNRIAKGVASGDRKIVDIAPTILHLMGLPLSYDMDGRVINAALVPAARTRPYFVRNFETLKPPDDIPFDELETLEEKLRTLGYIR